MSEKLRTLNAKGIAEFESFILALATGNNILPPKEILSDSKYSDALEPSVDIDERLGGVPFASRFDFGVYLRDLLLAFDQTRITRNYGLWNWLSLFYFDQLCPLSPDGLRKVFAKELYVILPSQIYRQYFRHLVRAPWLVVNDHRENARVLLVGSERRDEAPLAGRGYIFEQLASRQNILNNQTIIATAQRLYFDEREGRPRYGAGGKGAGSSRRFALVVQQLELTFDTRACGVPQLLSLLPKEFDDWKRRIEASVY
jgi:hypothetical protein